MSDKLLFRQIHRNFIQNGVVSTQAFTVTSQAFKPTPKDQNKLSMYDSEKFSAEESYLHYTDLGHSSFGVLALSENECIEESLFIEYDNYPFDGHTSIDFSNISSKNQVEKVAKKLRNKAISRNWQYLSNSI